MESFTVEGSVKTWPKMFEAAVPQSGEDETDSADVKLGKDLLAAAKKLAAPGVEQYGDTANVRVSVLSTTSGGFVRNMLDVYVSPAKG